MRVIDIVFVRENLRLLMLKAKRRGVWFKALSQLDRALINLTIKVADKVRSLRLVKALHEVLKKMEEALKNKIYQAICRVGFPLARKISLLAKKWGNHSADSWMSDLSFASFLAIMYVNSSQHAPSAARV